LLKKSKVNGILLSNDNLGDTGFDYLVKTSLAMENSLMYLTFTSVNLSSDSLDNLAKLIDCSNLISLISISNSNFEVKREKGFDLKAALAKKDSDGRDGCSLLKSFSKNKSLEEISFINCNLGAECPYMVYSFSVNPDNKIKILNFSQNGLVAEDLKQILEAAKNLKMRYLILNGNKVEDLGMFHLYDYLQETYPHNSNGTNYEERIQFIELEQNGITDKGIKLIINAIEQEYYYLKNLNLKFNKISRRFVEQTAQAIVDFSKENEKKMDIGKVGLDNIFKYLNISQISIDLRRNLDMTDEDYHTCFTDVVQNEYDRFFY